MGFFVSAAGTLLEFDTPFCCGDDEVLYLEGKRKSVALLVDALRDKADSVLSKYAQRPMKIITLRELVKRGDFMEKVLYQFPFLPQDTPLESYEELSARLWDRLDLKGNLPLHGAFLWFGEDPTLGFFPVQSSWEALVKGFELLGEEIDDILSSIRNSMFESIWASRAESPEDTADRRFGSQYDSDAEKVMAEVRERIAHLRSVGVDEVVIRSLFWQDIKLSRLVITEDFRILLPDYNNMEIEMEPLPKALYILFLRHPEGLVFKHMSVCRRELLRIYSAITRRENPDAVVASIDRLLDSTNNSINEKCSRIKAAFLARFADEIAENYYITNQDAYTTDVVPNEIYNRLWYKGISLDRDLVTFECKI